MSVILNLDVNEKTPCENIYTLLKTSSSKTNKKIKQRLEKFDTARDLISFYTKKDLNAISFLSKSLETTFKHLTNFTRNTKHFSSEIDQYISNYANVLLVINLISKYQSKLNQILKSTKIYLSKIQIKNSSLDLYNASINKLLSNIRSRKYSRRSTKEDTVLSGISSFLNKNSENTIDEESFKDSVSTARFHDIDSVENIETDNLKINTDLKRNESQMTISKMVFTPAKNTCKYSEEFSIDFKNIMKTSTLKDNSTYNLTSNLFGNIMSLRDDKRKNTEMCLELLETINNMYKSCLICAEEKIQLKQMIISKKNKLEKIYLNYHDKKDLLYKELKNLLQKEDNK